MTVEILNLMKETAVNTQKQFRVYDVCKKNLEINASKEQINEKYAEIEKLQNTDVVGMHRNMK